MDILDQWKSAVRTGDVARVRRLFESHPELADHVNDQMFDFDRSAVFECRDNLPLIDLLLEYGADLNQKTGWPEGGFGLLEGIDPALATPLIERGAIIDIWSAVWLNRTEDVHRLLEQNPSLITAPGGDGKHPVHYAPDVAMVDLLVERGADVNARDVDHASTPVQYLVENEPVVRRLLEHGAKPDIFLAAALGDLQLAGDCVTRDPAAVNARMGQDPWSNDAGGHIYHWTLGHEVTPLDVARQRGHEEVLEFLLGQCSPRRRLTDAIWQADERRVETLLAAEPKLLRQLTDDDRQMLARAAWSYRPAVVRLMLKLGFDPHVEGVHHSTPLDRAAFHGYADIVALLLGQDPNPPLDRKNEFGGTPLGTCLWGFRHGWKTGYPQDHLETVRLLLEAGARRAPNAPAMNDPAMDALLARYPSRAT